MKLVRATGIVAAVTFAWALVMLALTGNPQLTKIQLEAEPAAVIDVRMDADKLDASRLALHLDFLLLVLYGASFVLLGVLLRGRRHRGRWFSIAGAAVVAGAVITCVCDVVENIRTLRLIPADGTGEISETALDALRTVSYTKWAASALTVAIITLLFVGRERSRIIIAMAVVTGAAALLGLIGVAAQSRVTLQIYFAVLAVLLLAVAVVFVLRPRALLHNY